MFNGIGVTKGLSFIKILGGLSKTLQVANQIIPLYQKARPAINNARNMLAILKEMNKTTPSSTNNANTNTQTSNSTNTLQTTKKMPDQPTFFL